MISAVLAITLFFAGDSTLESRKYLENGDWPEDEKVLGSWCDALEPCLKAGCKIDNRAKSGRSTKSFIDEGLWTNLVADVRSGDFVYIQFGHNDQKASRPDVYAPARGAYVDNLTRFVNEVRAKGANPVLGTPMVRRFFTSDGEVDDRLGEYPAVVRELGKRLGVPVFDFNEMTRRMVRDVSREESLSWYRAAFNKTDMTHPSRQGAKVLAAAMLKKAKAEKFAFAGLFDDSKAMAK